ncbi:MAG: hypothetical protein AAF678_05460 [Pseudomonadota bacterium]
MSGLAIFAAILFSLAGLAYLTSTDSKRRRTHDLAKIDKRSFVWPARVASFGPGIYLTAIGHWSGLAIWAGAVTTLGWVIAAITPQTYARLKTDLRVQSDNVRDKAHELLQRLYTMPARYVSERLRAWRIDLSRLSETPLENPQAAEMDALKARITALEARLARMETGEPEKNDSIEPEDEISPSSTTLTPGKPLDAAE